MKSVPAFRQARLLVVALLVGCQGAETATPTLVRICQPENKTAWLSVSGLCHVLDFYGLGPTDLPSLQSGERALKALTDEETAIQIFGKSPLVKTESGLRYALFDEMSVNVDLGEAHRDQCLAAFAALDVPLSTPIHLRSGAYSIADLLADSLASFDFKQRELAWSAMAFAKYVPPETQWTNRNGVRLNFSELVGALLRTDFNAEKCAGIHIFEALILIRNADRRSPILDDAARERLNSFLKATIAELVQRQQINGSWNKAWCGAVKDDNGLMSPFQMSFLVTGHLLEVLDKLDPAFRPERKVYLKAASWITHSINSPEIRPNGFWLCPFTHAAHGAREVLKP